MSIDIHWDTLTSGPDGEALAETIRAFIHDRFQQVPLPKLIRSVQVHAFEFGQVAPEIEVRDVCDPLPDFYEEDEDDDEDESSSQAQDAVAQTGEKHDRPGKPTRDAHSRTDATAKVSHNEHHRERKPSQGASIGPSLPPLDTARAQVARTDSFTHPHLSATGNSTPGIPGGTANLSYFHIPFSGGLSGTHTPLAAFPGGAQFHHPFPHYPLSPTHEWVARQHLHHASQHHVPPDAPSTPHSLLPSAISDLPLRPASAPYSRDRGPSISSQVTSPRSPALAAAAGPGDENSSQPVSPPSSGHAPRMRPKSPNDLQVVARCRYNGDVRLVLTADIVLDSPMPSFVGIPLKLTVTGVSFDGLAILAYIQRRAHLCFLSPHDARELLGDIDIGSHAAEPPSDSKDDSTDSLGADNPDGQAVYERQPGVAKDMGLGLLEEIKVESEIGQREGGKQLLKNVGKVEKFILEQVQRIFEEEFVYPSFWTFLV